MEKSFTAPAERYVAILRFLSNATRCGPDVGHHLALALDESYIIRWSVTMKLHSFKIFPAASLVLGLALGFAQMTPVLYAQSQNQDPNAQQDQQKPRTFMGKIVKINSGQYALLTDEQAGKGVFLDDQEKAKQFEGKNVKVTGVLDIANKIVHVTNIEPA